MPASYWPNSRVVWFRLAMRQALGVEIAKLLAKNGVLRQAMRKRPYSSSRAMTWQRERTAERYMSVFENAGRRHRLETIRAHRGSGTLLRDSRATRRKCSSAISCRCATTRDCFGASVHSVPDRAHGYCASTTTPGRYFVACALG